MLPFLIQQSGTRIRFQKSYRPVPDFFKFFSARIFEKWHLLINEGADSKRTRTLAWKLTHATGKLQESERWKPELRISAGSGFMDCQTQNLVFEYGIISISFKMVKIFKNNRQKRTQQAEISHDTEFQANCKRFIFWLNFGYGQIFRF